MQWRSLDAAFACLRGDLGGLFQRRRHDQCLASVANEPKAGATTRGFPRDVFATAELAKPTARASVRVVGRARTLA